MNESCVKPMYNMMNAGKFAKHDCALKKMSIVDKWSANILLRVETGGDWCRIIDREVSILKVKIPFLPEKQIRGKAYVKFGIPSIMGEVRRPGLLKLRQNFAKELLKRRKLKPKIYGIRRTRREKVKNEEMEADHLAEPFGFHIDENLEFTRARIEDESLQDTDLSKDEAALAAMNLFPNGLKLSFSIPSDRDETSAKVPKRLEDSNLSSDESVISLGRRMFEEDIEISPKPLHYENMSSYPEKENCIREWLEKIDIDPIKNALNRIEMKEYSNSIYCLRDTQMATTGEINSMSNFDAYEESGNDTAKRKNELPLRFSIYSEAAVINENVRNDDNSYGIESTGREIEKSPVSSDGSSLSESLKIHSENDNTSREIPNCNASVNTKEGNISSMNSLLGDNLKEDADENDSEESIILSVSSDCPGAVKRLDRESFPKSDSFALSYVGPTANDTDSSDEDWKGFTESQILDSSSYSQILKCARKPYAKGIECHFQHLINNKKLPRRSPKNNQESFGSIISMSTTISETTNMVMISSPTLLSNQCCEYDTAYFNETLKPQLHEQET